MKTKSALFGLFFAALALPGFGQLTISNTPTAGVALALQSSSGTVLTYSEVSAASFTLAGLDFSLVPNYATGDLIVGSGVDGTFFANVSFIGRESMRPNYFGVSTVGLALYNAGGNTLYGDYTDADKPVTKAITAATYQEINFWHYADKPGYTGTFFMDDVLSFRTWEAVDVDANRIYTIFGIDDLRSAAIDFDDGVFLLERNLQPIAFENQPVPEPSTLALCGGLALLGLVAYRKYKISAGVVPCGARSLSSGVM